MGLTRVLPTLLLLFAFIFVPPLQGGRFDHYPALPDSVRGSDTTRWYDTLTVTKPKRAEQTDADRVALGLFVMMAVPATIAVGLLTLAPPSLIALHDDGRLIGGFAFSTGLGFGGSASEELIYFPQIRTQVEGAWFFSRPVSTLLRVSVLRDAPLLSIDRRDFYWVAAAYGAGVSTDFRETGIFAEGMIGLANPLGLRYVTLYPMHNYGIRGRIGWDVATGRPWYEVGLAATSTFGW